MNSMIRFFSPLIVWLLLCLCLSGCSRLNGTRLEPLLGGEFNLVRLGDKVAETLISQTLPPLIPQQPEQPVLVATLVSNDNLDQASNFGRSFQNHIAAGFVNRGFTVKEVKLRRTMLIEEHKGEFLLTRDLRELAGKQRAQAVVVGTYTMANRVMYLSVRLVAPGNQSIRAVYEDKLYLDENTLNLLGLKFKNGAGGDDSEEILPPGPSFLDELLY